MEPERKIEKLLRAFAKKRREQAGDAFEIPAGAREQLQREISRRSTRKIGGGFFSSFFAGPRLAFAVCFIVLAAIGAWLLLPGLTGEKPASLASATLQKAKSRPAEQPAPTMAPPATRVPELNGESSRQMARIESNRGTPEISSASPPEGRGEVALNVQRDKERFANEKQIALTDTTAPKQVQPSEMAVNGPAVISDGEAPAPARILENGLARTNSFVSLNAAAIPPASGILSDKTEAPMDLLAHADALNKDRADLPFAPAAPELDTNAAFGALTLAAAEPDAQKKLGVQPAPMASPAGAVVFDSVVKGENAGVRTLASQNFHRVDALARRSAKIPVEPVLTSFRVEQNGGEMRIVDADGSIYTGTLQTVAEELVSGKVVASAFKSTPAISAAKARPQAEPARNYFFRVAGTNRNSGQNVVFTGNLIPITNGLFSWTNAATLGGSAGAAVATPEPAAAWMLLNSRISGTAVIGNHKGIEVNATPAR